ncbi:MAG: D-alanine--D-alanine ligase [Candidatus Zhuqueibacterota bacterium]
MKSKIRVGIIFGGKSVEHEVSLQSAKNIFDAIDRDTYDVVLIGIDKKGQWHLNDAERFLQRADNPKLIKLFDSADNLALVPGEKSNQVIRLKEQQSIGRIDVVFPILHGPFGEDGTIQGLLKLANVPFVGASVLGSAVGMDKDVMKRLLRDAGIPIARFITVNDVTRALYNFDSVVGAIGLPFFVKPANLGSSVGISRVSDAAEFERAVADAFQYDTKVLYEQNIIGREIECSVLGNLHPTASLPGEIITNRDKHEFYSYEAKYIDEKGASLQIPADVPEAVVARVQELAVKTFTALNCEGMARVDFFLTKNNELIVNELNSIPGFTKISMYPKLWEASGISYCELIDKLLQLALERFEREQKLKTSVEL